MATLTYEITISEVRLDSSGNAIAEYTENLPHQDDIIAAALKLDLSHLADVLNARLGQHGVERVRSWASVRSNKQVVMTISVEAAPRFRWSERRRNIVFDELDTQLVDGWGEGFFGYANVMVGENGHRFFPETATMPIA